MTQLPEAEEMDPPEPDMEVTDPDNSFHLVACECNCNLQGVLD